MNTNTNTTMYTHAYKPGTHDPSRYYWCISVVGDHSAFYTKQGYATLVNHERDARSILPLAATAHVVQPA